MTYSLEIKNLTKTYADSAFRLDNVSFAIPRGTIMGFVGENGAGKTTTMNAILNTVKRDGGSVTFFGREMEDQDTDLREQLGVVFDAVNFSGVLTPSKLSRVMAGVYRRWDPDMYLSSLTRFGIPLNVKIKQLSRGMTMKLALAVALSHGAKLLILDEATAGLDPIVRDEILDVFLEFVEDDSRSILMSSHITSDLEKIADYITFIHRGKVILTESKDKLIYEYGIARCKAGQFQDIDPADRLAYRKRDYQIDVLVEDRKAFERKYAGIIVDRGTIDEIMLLLIKGDQ
ncbi:ABC transporter ATP-binding protein ['Paenibacillus yunnanensis' Narsing Rao et al. 2020]|uniref:ABC transporter ATP-binding protein n=1 Tax=Paenibacillus tengchongensis TaxID=2608684 RepID=UPI00124E0CBC|nr:ABC transporter ATP-binding protein [Paenibacillus tengchongensis]